MDRNAKTTQPFELKIGDDLVEDILEGGQEIIAYEE